MLETIKVGASVMVRSLGRMLRLAALVGLVLVIVPPVGGVEVTLGRYYKYPN